VRRSTSQNNQRKKGNEGNGKNQKKKLQKIIVYLIFRIVESCELRVKILFFIIISFHVWLSAHGEHAPKSFTYTISKKLLSKVREERTKKQLSLGLKVYRAAEKYRQR
jgi:hypothetical protein